MVAYGSAPSNRLSALKKSDGLKENRPMRRLIVVLLACALSACAADYVAVDGGAHTGDIRIGKEGSR
jgi:hypothetical protein